MVVGRPSERLASEGAHILDSPIATLLWSLLLECEATEEDESDHVVPVFLKNPSSGWCVEKKQITIDVASMVTSTNRAAWQMAVSGQSW